MNSRIVYALEIMENGKHNSFDYDTEEQAYKAYEYLVEKFGDNRIIDKGSVNFKDDIIQLSICKTHIGHVPIGSIANYSPYEWFKEEHENIIRSAKDYYEKNK